MHPQGWKHVDSQHGLGTHPARADGSGSVTCQTKAIYPSQMPAQGLPSQPWANGDLRKFPFSARMCLLPGLGEVRALSLTLEAPHGAASPGQWAGTATCALAPSCTQVEWRSLLGAEGDGESRPFQVNMTRPWQWSWGRDGKREAWWDQSTGGCEKTAGSPSQRGREARAGRTVRELRL